MRILVTAGNTLVPVDRVRYLTNIFTGRTGASIARAAHGNGHGVTLLTSHPESLSDEPAPNDERWRLLRFSTFDDLRNLMREEVQRGKLEAVIHSAAVADYLAAGVFAPAPGTHFSADTLAWTGEGTMPTFVDRGAGKVKSDEPELWLRLVRAPKLVDLLRSDWGFRGVLVKFKLEVGLSERQLLEVAERSRLHSQADLMVANTLEGAANWALVGKAETTYQKVGRRDLAQAVVAAVEQIHTERTHG
jgi:phosphopantothenoylcysteine synthetase/decarboxylase